jgi:serine-type D-Ala-D-Ala carboxypeptidase/endopeptidase (penicillin-binding protein 4)
VRVQLPGGLRLHGWQVVAIPLLALLTILAVVLSLLGWLPGQSGSPSAGPSTSPSATASASPSASTPVVAPAQVLAPASDAGLPPTTAGLTAALGPLLQAKALGNHVGGAVVDLSTGQLAYGSDATGAFAPASTTKLLTAAAALSTLGPQFRIQTKVVAGSTPGQIILVGGGDPTLATSAPAGFVPAPASISALAAATAAALRSAGTTTVALGYDTTLFAPPRVAPTWPSTYVSTGVVSPVTALSLDEGRVGSIVEGTAPRVPDPPLSAAKAFARRLAALGVKVTGVPTPVTAPAAPTGATASPSASPSGSAGATPSPTPAAPGSVLAVVRSPALSDLVGWMLSTSDNDLAEALAHLTAIRAGQAADFDGGVAAVTAAVAALGLPTAGLHLYDGSGLTGSTQASPALLADVLAVADSPSHAVLRPLLTGLAVAGFTGSLTTRFDDPSTRHAAGLVRGKTGTLSAVSSIAGTVLDADGHELAFVFLADEIQPGSTLAARAALDKLAAAVAGCGCR